MCQRRAGGHPVLADDLELSARKPRRHDAGKRIDQQVDMPAREDRTDVEHDRIARLAGLGPVDPGAEVDHPDAARRLPQARHDLALRELGDRQDQPCPPRAPRRDRAAPQPFARREPLRVGAERHVVDGDRGGAGRRQRRRVARREEHVGTVGRERARQRPLFPPRSARARQQADLPGERWRHRRHRRRVQRPLVTKRIRRRAPLGQQLAEIASDAGRLSAELARIDGDLHGRCSTAAA